jgi:hypothetical protein
MIVSQAAHLLLPVRMFAFILPHADHVQHRSPPVIEFPYVSVPNCLPHEIRNRGPLASRPNMQRIP